MHVKLDWGPVASSKYKEAFAFFREKDYAQAVNLLEEEMTLHPDKYGYFALGQTYIAMQDPVKALQSLLEAVKLDKFYHEALSLLGDVYLAHGQMMAAVESYGQAVAIDPACEPYKQRLVNVVSSMRFIKTNPNLKGVLIECMESTQIEMMFMGAAWLSMVKRDASVGPYYKLSKRESYGAFEKGMARFDNCDGLIDPFFLTGLGQFIVPGLKFESWIKNLRCYVLKSIIDKKPLFSDARYIDMITCALSRYCFLTDYIMPYTEEEGAMLDVLEKRILQDAPKVNLSELACYGCYKYLYALSGSKEIAAELKGGNHVSQIPKSQIQEYWEQKEIASGIEILGEIEDKTSLDVQAQYEVFPYPRWGAAPKGLFDPEIVAHLENKKAEILVAGCGTGKEAALASYAFPNAKITAVDLSKTSLAYAMYKARQFGIENVRFYQADIMNLVEQQGWTERFDYIASAGVLHHMKDPKAGWNVLCRALKKGGVMDIGLYSHYARWAVSEAREVIRDADIGSDAQAIRAFRQNVRSHLKHKAIKNLEGFSDYYNLSECRDLLFHVQEHQFDLLQVKSHLDDLGVEFVKFNLDAGTIEKYLKQNGEVDPDATNLELWDKWERKNPDLFVAMYRFWCRKV
jgi:SAM-dependent methyltransferase